MNIINIRNNLVDNTVIVIVIMKENFHESPRETSLYKIFLKKLENMRIFRGIFSKNIKSPFILVKGKFTKKIQ